MGVPSWETFKVRLNLEMSLLRVRPDDLGQSLSNLSML